MSHLNDWADSPILDAYDLMPASEFVKFATLETECTDTQQQS